MSCSVDLGGRWIIEKLMLWHRPAATDPIRPLASEPPYATSAALKKTKDKKKTEFIHVFAYIYNISWKTY